MRTRTHADPVTSDFVFVSRHWSLTWELFLLIFHKMLFVVCFIGHIKDSIATDVLSLIIYVRVNYFFTKIVGAYLIKLLRSQGMPGSKLHVIFAAFIIISRISYVLSAWGSFLNSQQINRNNVFFRKARRFGLCSSTCPVSYTHLTLPTNREV